MTVLARRRPGRDTLTQVAVVGLAFLGSAAPAAAKPRSSVRDFPVSTCPVHSGKPVSSDGLTVLTAAPTRFRDELRFTASGTQQVVTFSTCSVLGNVLKPEATVALSKFAVVRSAVFLSNQVDRREFTDEPFGKDDCYQEPGQVGWLRTAGTHFDPQLKAACGSTNPDCPFADDFTDDQHWTHTDDVVFDSNEMRLTSDPLACSSTAVTIADLVPGETYIVDYDWSATGFQQSDALITVDVGKGATRVDFDQDDKPDILWRNQASGRLATWSLDGAQAVRETAVTPNQVANTNWHVEGVADFDGDGRPDLFWRNQTSGLLAVWSMNGAAAVRELAVSPNQMADTNWHVEGVADLDGDARPDLLWRNQLTGGLAVWRMDGTTRIDEPPFTPNQVPASWHVEGVADFDGDGRPDLLWRNQASGLLAVWFLKGTEAIRESLLNPSRVPDTSWHIEDVDDFNSDGKPDLLWRNQTTGRLVVFFMDGTTATSASQLTPSQVPPSWKIECR